MTTAAVKRSSSGGVSPAKRLQYEQQQSSTELFSKYIATSLEALPPRLAIQAQKDLHDVLVKYKMMEFDQEDEGSISTIGLEYK